MLAFLRGGSEEEPSGSFFLTLVRVRIRSFSLNDLNNGNVFSLGDRNFGRRGF